MNGSTNRRGHHATRDERIRKHTPLPVTPLASFQGIIVCSGREVDWPAIVGEKREESIFEHALPHERLHEPANNLVHEQHHGVVHQSALQINWITALVTDRLVELTDCRDWRFQRRVKMGADPVHRRVHKDGLLKAGRICIFVTAILTPGFGALLAFARVCHLARIRVTTAVRLIVREEVKHQAETHVDLASR